MKNEFSTRTEISEGFKLYISSVFIGPLKEYHTGNFQCIRTDRVKQPPDMPKVYIYVPG